MAPDRFPAFSSSRVDSAFLLQLASCLQQGGKESSFSPWAWGTGTWSCPSHGQRYTLTPQKIPAVSTPSRKSRNQVYF